MISFQFVKLLCQCFNFSLHFLFSTIILILECLVFVYQLVTGLLPLPISLLYLFNKVLVLLEEIYSDTLIQVNKMIPYFDNVLIITLLKSTITITTHHTVYLHFQILNEVANICGFPSALLVFVLILSLLIDAVNFAFEIDTLFNE
jgi:hypothetical protein